MQFVMFAFNVVCVRLRDKTECECENGSRRHQHAAANDGRNFKRTIFSQQSISNDQRYGFGYNNNELICDAWPNAFRARAMCSVFPSFATGSSTSLIFTSISGVLRASRKCTNIGAINVWLIGGGCCSCYKWR